VDARLEVKWNGYLSKPVEVATPVMLVVYPVLENILSLQ
jgi:hypothetical protein